MPPIRQLVTDPPPAGSVGAAVATNPNGKPAGNDGAALAIPSFLSGNVAIPSTIDQIHESAGGNYVDVATNRNGKWLQLKAAGIAEGEFYLSADDKFTKVHPLRFFCAAGDLFKTKMDSLGNIVAATRDMSADKELDEHVVALLIVDTGDKLVPAKADFRRTWAAPGVVALRALRDAVTPEWAKDNPGAAGFNLPFGRVIVTATTAAVTSRTSGNRYFRANATSGAAQLTDMQRLAAALQDAVFLADLTRVKDGYDKRVEQLAKLCK